VSPVVLTAVAPAARLQPRRCIQPAPAAAAAVGRPARGGV